MNSSDIGQLFKDTFSAWRDDKASRLAAALAYYSLFSLAPLLIIAIAIAGQVYGDEAASGRIVAEASRYLGTEAAIALESMVESARQPEAGLIAGIIGVVTLLLGASGVFNQLRGALDVIWQVAPAADRGVKGLLRDRLEGLLIVIGLGALLLISFFLSVAVNLANNLASDLVPVSFDFLPVLNIILTFVLMTFLFAFIYKQLPRVQMVWRDVWVGAAATALLFTLGKELIGLYLGYSGPGSAYGAAGSVIVILVWVYYSAQVMLLGAEFTKIYARRFGSQVDVQEGAIRYRRVYEYEPTLATLTAAVAAEDVQLRVAPLPQQARPVQQAPANGQPAGRESLLWLPVTVAAFTVGLIVGGRRR